MGAIEVEVKILRGKTPVLVTWENPIKKVVESILVTCQCQGLGLDIDSTENTVTTSQSTASHSTAAYSTAAHTTTAHSTAAHTTTVYTKRTHSIQASNLTRALEMADVVTCTSLDPLESLANHLKFSDEFDLTSSTDGCKHPSKRKKNKLRKKFERKKVQTRKLPKKTKNYILANTVNSTSSRESDVGTDADEQTTAEAKNKEEDLLQERTKEEDVSMSENESQSSLDHFEKCPDNDDINVSPNEWTEENTNHLDSGEEKLGDETSNVYLQSSDLETETDEGEQCLLNASDKAQNLTGTMDTVYVDIDNVENVVVIPASSMTPISLFPGDQAVMKTISSILETQPETSMTESYLSPDVSGNISIGSSARVKVNVIRSLTEVERRRMFQFRSDSETKNRYELENNGTKAYLCEYCGKVLCRSTRMRHLQTHVKDREKNNMCEICGKGFHNLVGLKHHRETHDDSLTFDCRYCSKKYKTMYGRTVHERQHFAILSENCGKCEEKFKDLRDLKKHLKYVHEDHGNDSAPDRKSRRGGLPGQREVLHDGQVGTTTCHICNKVVKNRSFRVHLSRHDGKLFTCLLCGKVMAHTSRDSHMLLHTGQKDHKCDICGKCFAQRPSLTVHRRMHTGERPIKCRHCDRGFTRHWSREIHEASHTGVRPFKCTICDKSWKDRSSYGIHMKKNHPGELLVYKRLSAQINSQRGKISARLEIITAE